MNKIVTAYKLFRVRKDGSIGSLFFARKDKLPIGKWLVAKAIRKEGFAFRMGWHAVPTPNAPHLSQNGRAWYRVELRYVTRFNKPECQGGEWFIAKRLRILGMV